MVADVVAVDVEVVEVDADVVAVDVVVADLEKLNLENILQNVEKMLSKKPFLREVVVVVVSG